MTITTLISNIRETVKDVSEGSNTTRWSDNNILSVINEGILDLCYNTNYIKKTGKILPTAELGIFELPADVKTLTNVVCNGCNLDLVSESDLERLCCNYRTQTGIPRYATKSSMSKNKLRITPAPKGIE